MTHPHGATQMTINPKEQWQKTQTEMCKMQMTKLRKLEQIGNAASGIKRDK